MPDSFCCAANGGIPIRIRSLLNERSTRRQESCADVAGLIRSSSESIHICDAHPDPPNSSAETAQREMQPTLNVRLQSFGQVCIKNANVSVHFSLP